MRNFRRKSKLWKGVTVLFAVFLVTLPVLSQSAWAAQEREEGQAFPTVYLEHLRIDTQKQKNGPDSYPLHWLDNDLFYLEYPGSWVMGANDYCPFSFYDDSDYDYEKNEIQSFQDAQLEGTTANAENYIGTGGINRYIEQVLGRALTPEEHIVKEEVSDPILYYSLMRGSTDVATIIIWCNIGQVSIRSEVYDVAVNPVTNHGKIMLIPEWDTTDFSSVESIKAFVSTGGMKPYMDYLVGDLTWNMSEYSTEYHQFVYCEGETEMEKIAVYIPVASGGKKNWVLGFQTYKASQTDVNAYKMKEEIVKSFKVLK